MSKMYVSCGFLKAGSGMEISVPVCECAGDPHLGMELADGA